MRQNVLHENIPCNCTAKIHASFNGADPMNVKVTYHWRHEGHVPGSTKDMTSAPISREEREVIATMVDESLTWRNIKHALRVDKDALAQIISNPGDTNVPLAMRISYNDVHYQMSQAVKRKARLNDSMQESLKLWSDKIMANNGGYVFFDQDLDEELGAFCFAFMSDWQFKVFYYCMGA